MKQSAEWEDVQPSFVPPPKSQRSHRWRRTAGVAISTRLLLIIALCMLPSIVFQLASSWHQWTERKAQLGDLARHQAELLAGDMDSIVAGAKILLGAAAIFQQSRVVEEGCNARLETLQHDAQGYAFLALADPDGQIRCASDPGLIGETNQAWVQGKHPPREGFTAGQFTRMGTNQAEVLPFFLPIAQSAASRGGTLIAALDLHWLAQHLVGLKRAGSAFLTGGVLTISDSAGVILARDVRHDEFVGRPFPPDAMSLVTAQEPGILRLKSVDGTERVVGYTPPNPSHYRLAALVGFFEPDLMRDVEQTLWGGIAMLVAVSIAAFLLVSLLARRFITEPTRALLAVADRWRQGDLSVRAPDAGRSEFGQLALAFNEMTAALENREHQLRDYAGQQEARVVERTRELMEANQRLQAEIAERRATEAALLQAQKVQAVGQLAGGIAHDFNNILQTVSGAARLLGQRAGDPDAVRRLSEMIRDSAQRGESVTRRLLAFSRREELRAEVLELGDLLPGLCEVLAATFGSRYALRADIAAGLPRIVADRGQLETVLVNLATNARDAMPDGGPLVLRAAAEDLPGDCGLPPGRYVRLSIEDDGEGMSPDILARATEPFFTTKPLGQGTGLGLAMARSFAEGSGGKLTIASAAGQGTKVTLLLPAKAEAAHPAEEPRADLGKYGRCAARILLVDDEQAVRLVLAEELREFGYEVVEASDGTAALEMLEVDRAFHVLVTDLAMPGLDGVALIRAAQQKRPDIRAVLVTGYVGEAARAAVEGAVPGTVQLMQKPVTGSGLADRVAVLLGSGQGVARRARAFDAAS
jgi:signal transduction histidine kinase/CheY-like chemotaxis protein